MRILFFYLILFPLCVFAQNIEIKTSNYFDMLTNNERRIIVNKGTEPSWSGKYIDNFKQGIYLCKACNNPLYNSNSKFQSNCGWPSFDDEIEGAIMRKIDSSFGMIRVEICCSNCKGHLGHVFEGEKLTEKNTRHCVNSISINFIPTKLE